MPSAMHAVWLLTVIANVTLILVLFFRGHYIKFSWLTTTTVLAVFSDAILAILRAQNVRLHTLAHSFIFTTFLIFEVRIILEALKWGKKWVRVPMEILIVLQLIALGASESGALWPAYYLNCFVGVYNLAITAYFIAKFEKEPFYE